MKHTAAKMVFLGGLTVVGLSCQNEFAEGQGRDSGQDADGGGADEPGDGTTPDGSALGPDGDSDGADGGAEPSAREPYEKDYPPYDCNAADAVAIGSYSDLKTYLNDTSKRILCVEPGIDLGEEAELKATASGNQGAPRYLVLGDDLDVHPADLAVGARGILPPVHIEGDYWVVHRVAFSRNRGGRILHLLEDAAFNIVDQILVEGGGGGGGGVAFKGESHDNTIQRSLIRKTEVGTGSDVHCMVVSGGANNRIVSCEVYDCGGDSIQVHRGGAAGHGTIIANNDLYNTAEQPLDFKAGGTQANPLRVVRNRLSSATAWGVGTSNTRQCMISTRARGAPDAYFQMEDNILWDCFHTHLATSGGASEDPISNVSLRGNLFYGDPISDHGQVIQCDECMKWELYFNVFVNLEPAGWFRRSGTVSKNEFLCNALIDGGELPRTLNSTNTSDYHAYYSTPGQIGNPGTHDLIHANASDANMADYCFDFKRLSGPEEVCLSGAATTKGSPHYSLCDGITLGTTADRGIDDEPYVGIWPGLGPR